MFEDSPVTKKILNYGSKITGQIVSPRIYTKVLSIHSATSPYPRLPLFDIGRSREFKSISSSLAMQMFPKDFYIDLAGDTTIHGLKEEYGKKHGNITVLNLHGKCLNLDEGNALFLAMHKKSSNRWLTCISTVYTRRKYEISAQREKFVIIGYISFVINMNSQSFKMHKDLLFETNIADRSLIMHSQMCLKDHFACRDRFEKSKGLKPPVFIKERYTAKIRNLHQYEGQLKALANDYGTLGERNPAECYDIVTATASENARLNQRDYLTNDDIRVVEIIRPYTADPASAKIGIRILMLLKQGKRPTDICHILHKDPSKFLPIISYYKKKYQLRGALDWSET